MDIIRECYKDNYIHSGYIDLDSFEEALKAGKEKCVERIKEEIKYRCLDDIHSVMSGWVCFEEDQNQGFHGGDYDNDYDFNPGSAFHNAHHKKKNKNKNKMTKASKKKNRKKK